MKDHPNSTKAWSVETTSPIHWFPFPWSVAGRHDFSFEHRYCNHKIISLLSYHLESFGTKKQKQWLWSQLPHHQKAAENHNFETGHFRIGALDICGLAIDTWMSHLWCFFRIWAVFVCFSCTCLLFHPFAIEDRFSCGFVGGSAVLLFCFPWTPTGLPYAFDCLGIPTWFASRIHLNKICFKKFGFQELCAGGSLWWQLCVRRSRLLLRGEGVDSWEQKVTESDCLNLLQEKLEHEQHVVCLFVCLFGVLIWWFCMILYDKLKQFFLLVLLCFVVWQRLRMFLGSLESPRGSMEQPSWCHSWRGDERCWLRQCVRCFMMFYDVLCCVSEWVVWIIYCHCNRFNRDWDHFKGWRHVKHVKHHVSPPMLYVVRFRLSFWIRSRLYSRLGTGPTSNRWTCPRANHKWPSSIHSMVHDTRWREHQAI